MSRFPIVATFVTIFIYLASAGDDCPALNSLQNFCSCSQYIIPTTDNTLTTQNSTPNYTPPLRTTPKNTSHTSRSMHRSAEGRLSSLRNPIKSVAITTRPKIRDAMYYTEVHCNLMDTNRTSILQDLASELHRKWIDKLSVARLPYEKERLLVRLPNKWLNNARIIQFQVENSILSGDFIWKGDPFAGQKHSLVWLTAMGCSLTGALTYDTLGTVNLKGLEELNRLKGIDLSGNYLVSVEKSAFTHIHRELHTIKLSRNVLQEVEAGAFHNISKLRYIDLSHNLLENISRSIFPLHPSELKRINLSWNHFQSLPKDLFANMTALKQVDFSKNFLHSLLREPWDGVWEQLGYIDVSNNFLQCNCELLWLVERNIKEKERGRYKIKGQCGRAVPSIYVQHFNLNILEKNHLYCNDENSKDDDDYDG